MLPLACNMYGISEGERAGAHVTQRMRSMACISHGYFTHKLVITPKKEHEHTSTSEATMAPTPDIELSDSMVMRWQRLGIMKFLEVANLTQGEYGLPVLASSCDQRGGKVSSRS